MKLFGWMQNKFNKNTNVASSANHVKQEPLREEFSDWQHGLLTIGTFGNNDLPIKNEGIQETETETETDVFEFTVEEVGKVRKELTKLLTKKQETPADLPLDRFLNCPSSLEVDRRLPVKVNDSDNDKEEEIDQTIRVILGRCKDLCGKKTIGKKSFSFLFKKIFVCGNGFPSVPSFGDSLPETRMEKLLRAMLKNKIKPQASSARKQLIKDINNEEKIKENENGSKWVKTDSEYIVLEI